MINKYTVLMLLIQLAWNIIKTTARRVLVIRPNARVLVTSSTTEAASPKHQDKALVSYQHRR